MILLCFIAIVLWIVRRVCLAVLYPRRSLRGKTVLVVGACGTPATQYACYYLYHVCGCHVIAWDSSKTKLEELQQGVLRASSASACAMANKGHNNNSSSNGKAPPSAVGGGGGGGGSFVISTVDLSSRLLVSRACKEAFGELSSVSASNNNNNNSKWVDVVIYAAVPSPSPAAAITAHSSIANNTTTSSVTGAFSAKSDDATDKYVALAVSTPLLVARHYAQSLLCTPARAGNGGGGGGRGGDGTTRTAAAATAAAANGEPGVGLSASLFGSHPRSPSARAAQLVLWLPSPLDVASLSNRNDSNDAPTFAFASSSSSTSPASRNFSASSAASSPRSLTSNNNNNNSTSISSSNQYDQINPDAAAAFAAVESLQWSLPAWYAQQRRRLERTSAAAGRGVNNNTSESRQRSGPGASTSGKGGSGSKGGTSATAAAAADSAGTLSSSPSSISTTTTSSTTLTAAAAAAAVPLTVSTVYAPSAGLTRVGAMGFVAASNYSVFSRPPRAYMAKFFPDAVEGNNNNSNNNNNGEDDDDDSNNSNNGCDNGDNDSIFTPTKHRRNIKHNNNNNNNVGLFVAPEVRRAVEARLIAIQKGMERYGDYGSDDTINAPNHHNNSNSTSSSSNINAIMGEWFSLSIWFFPVTSLFSTAALTEGLTRLSLAILSMLPLPWAAAIAQVYGAVASALWRGPCAAGRKANKSNNNLNNSSNRNEKGASTSTAAAVGEEGNGGDTDE